MSNYVSARNHRLTLPIDVSGTQATLIIVISAVPVKGIADDDLSELSSVSGMFEQDLNGFDVSSSPPSHTKGKIAATSAEAGMGRLSPSRPSLPEPIVPEAAEVKKTGDVERHHHDKESRNIDEESRKRNNAGHGISSIREEDQEEDSMHSAVDTTSKDGQQHEKKGYAASQDRLHVARDEDLSVHSKAQIAKKDDVMAAEIDDTDGDGYYHDQEEHNIYRQAEQQQQQEEGEEEYYDEEGGEDDEVYYAEYAELEERLYEAEAQLAEAEELAQEALDDLEKERAARREAEALATQIQRDLEFANKKAAKERTEWEARMKDSFKKMEGTVLLTERVQKEKAELAERLAALAVEKKALEEMVDAASVEKKVDAATTAAIDAAESRAAVEIDALKKRIREMEAFVDDADARATAATSKAARLQEQLAGAAAGVGVGVGVGVSSPLSKSMAGAVTPVGSVVGAVVGSGMSQETWQQLSAAEERSDSLSLELQYAKAEVRTLEEEVKSARADADRSIAAARREAESHAVRAADFARQLEQARAASASAERNSSQAQARVVLLEDALERSNLQAAELQQRVALLCVSRSHNASERKEESPLMAPAASGDPVNALAPGVESMKKEGSGAAAVENPPDGSSISAQELRSAIQRVREVQDASEARAAQLAATSRDLVAAQEAVVALQSDVYTLQQELVDAQRMVSTRDEEIHQLKSELKGKATRIEELKKLHRDRASTNPKDDKAEHDLAFAPAVATSAAAAAAVADDASAMQYHEEEQLLAVKKQLSEAQNLARSSAQRAAECIQQLAHSQAGKTEATTRIEELREEVMRLRSGSSGELRTKIESLERELLVARNRADVNALFRQEHDRIASELIDTKLAWAEAQEQLVMLKRSLIKSQERSMSFASKVTSLETRLYKSFSNVTNDLRSVVATSVRRRKREEKKGGTSGEGGVEGAPKPVGNLTPRRRRTAG